MSRELLVRAGLRAYPLDVRETRGLEMTGTLLDVSAGSVPRFARELLSLVRIGLRTRATRVAAAGPRRVVADGVCLAAVWLLTLDLSTLLAQTVRGMQDPLLAPASIALLARRALPRADRPRPPGRGRRAAVDGRSHARADRSRPARAVGARGARGDAAVGAVLRRAGARTAPAPASTCAGSPG